MKIYYNNSRGIKSKQESFNEIIEEYQPDIIGLVETHLQQGEALEEIEGYVTISFERDSKGGGVMIAIKKNYKNIYREKEAARIKNVEWIQIHLGEKTRYKIGLVYLPQGDKLKVEEIKKIYKELKEEIMQGQADGRKLQLMGDFNAKIGGEVKGGSEKVNKGGR